MKFEIDALGTRIRLQFSGSGVTADNVDSVALSWSRCPPSGADTRPQEIHFFVDKDATRRAEASSRGALVFATFPLCSSAIAAVVTRTAIENAAPDLLLIHAAAVADPESGRVIGLIGSSGAGKTTAARALSASWGYVTDETLAVTLENLAVTAYPKPLSVINARNPRLKDQLGPDQLGLMRAPSQLHLTELVILRRDPEHVGPPQFLDIPLVEAIAVLVPQVSFLARRTRPIHDLLALLSVGGGVQHLLYRDVADLSPFLFQRRGQRPEPTSEPASDDSPPLQSPSPSRSSPRVESGDEQVLIEAAPVTDYVRIEGNVVLMASGEVVVLQGIGCDIWECSQSPIGFVDLVGEIVARHGIPESGVPRTLVRDHVRILQEKGIISVLLQ